MMKRVASFALNYSENDGSSFTTYYYVLNLQGDVVKLITVSGATVAEYTYNAWGEILTATGDMASINPLRYRSYYYDSETGFYYLQSRYYDPVTHRFIIADAIASTGQGFTGTNMFAYCNNNPVVLRDSTGNEPIETIDLDGDGEIDCYVYEYSYCTRIPIGMGVSGTVLLSGSGKVYIYKNMSETDFDNHAVPIPSENGNNIFVGDLRHDTDNPEMQVYNSYKVSDPCEREAIVKVMRQYDQEYPSRKAWGRSEASLLKEWIIHNSAYSLLSYERARSTNFDHDEEGWGWGDYFLKYLGLK